ncbi:Protein of unknown function [Gryllus bimaculatus]|nr:Protein of unknown function [Gryllus bimaculatus]
MIRVIQGENHTCDNIRVIWDRRDRTRGLE